jgi:hypothetical protein
VVLNGDDQTSRYEHPPAFRSSQHYINIDIDIPQVGRAEKPVDDNIAFGSSPVGLEWLAYPGGASAYLLSTIQLS